MENKAIIGIAFAILAVLLVTGFVAASPFGKGMFGNNLSQEDKDEMQQNHQAIREAVQNQDFTAWKALMEERIARMQEQITEENFNNLVQRHQQMEEFHNAMEEARETGDYSQIEALKEEYGIENGFGQGKGAGKGMGKMNQNCIQ